MKTKRQFRNKKKHYGNSKKKVYYGGENPLLDNYVTPVMAFLTAMDGTPQEKHTAYISLKDFLKRPEITQLVKSGRNIFDVDLQEGQWRPPSANRGSGTLLFKLLDRNISDEDIPIVNEIIGILQARGANMNILDIQGENIIVKELKRQRLPFIITLIRSGTDVNIEFDSVQSRRNRYISIVTPLLELLLIYIDVTNEINDRTDK